MAMTKGISMTGKFYLMQRGYCVRIGTKKELLALQDIYVQQGCTCEVRRGSLTGPEVLPDRAKEQGQKMMTARRAKANKFSWDTYEEGDPLPRGTL